MLIKKRMKAKVFILITIPFLIVLTGCGEFKDIDRMVFISMIGIDQTDDPEKPYKIILKLYVPTSSFRQNSTPEYTYLSKNGKTLAETISLLESHLDKELDFGHSKLIVVGEKILQNDNYKEILDFLIRKHDIQMISYFAVGRPAAEEIIKFLPAGETALQPTIFNYFDNNGAESSYIISTFLFDLRRRLKEEGLDPILPIVEMNEPKTHFIINKSIVLADNRPPYELDTDKTLLFKTLSMDAKRIFFAVKREGEYFVSRIDSIKSKYNVNVENKKASIKIEIKLAGMITESKKPLSNKELSRYSKMLDEEMKEKVSEFIHEMKREGYDPFGFGLKYYAHTLPKNRMTHEEWVEVYKNADVEVIVKSSLKSTGSIQ